MFFKVKFSILFQSLVFNFVFLSTFQLNNRHHADPAVGGRGDCHHRGVDDDDDPAGAGHDPLDPVNTLDPVDPVNTLDTVDTGSRLNASSSHDSLDPVQGCRQVGYFQSC